MTPTRVRFLTRTAVALGWTALVALVTTNAFAAERKPFCTTYTVKTDFCVPNGVDLSTCADWNVDIDNCVGSGREVVQAKKTECAWIPNDWQGHEDWLVVCVDKTLNGDPVLETCADIYKCKLVNISKEGDTAVFRCRQGDVIVPPKRRNAKTDSNVCISPYPVWWD